MHRFSSHLPALTPKITPNMRNPEDREHDAAVAVALGGAGEAATATVAVWTLTELLHLFTCADFVLDTPSLYYFSYVAVIFFLQSCTDPHAIMPPVSDFH